MQFHQTKQVIPFPGTNSAQKMDLGFEIQKTNVGTRISILEISYAPIFSQNDQL